MVKNDVEQLSKKQRRKQIQENHMKEYYRCVKNPMYFMRNYCYIKSQEDGSKTLFDLYGFQERALKEFLAYDYNTVLKTRQMGISTLCAGYSLWLALFNNDTDISYIATKQDVAQGLLKKVKIMHENLPSFMQEKKERDNLHSLELGNGSVIKANSSTSDAGRSESLSLLVIDEAAFIENAQEVWSSAKPTLSGGGEAIILSTPYGVGSWYHQIWTEAVQGATLVNDDENKEVWKGTGTNDFHPIKLHWSLHPNRDEEWRQKMGKNMEPREAAREYDCVSGDTKVFTRTGMQPVKSVQEGELVLTHEGRFMPVTNRQKVFKEDVYDVYTKNNTRHCSVSGGHPILTREGFKQAKNIKSGEEVAKSPRLIDLSDFFTSRSVDITEALDADPYSWESDEGKCWKTDRWKVEYEREVNFDNDLGWLLGYYMAEGHADTNNAAVYFSYNYGNEDHLIDRLERVLKNKFTDSITVSRRNQDGDAGQAMVSSSVVKSFVLKYVKGRKSHTKTLSQEAFALADEFFLRGVISGIMDGDGMTGETNYKRLSVTSGDMVDDVQFMASVLGFDSHTKRVEKTSSPDEMMGREINGQEYSHVLNFLRTKGVDIESGRFMESINDSGALSENPRVEEDFVWTELKFEEGDAQELYDIEVQGDSSFVTEHFVVHNCSFEQSGNTVVDPQDIKDINKSTVRDPEYKVRIRGQNSLWVWGDPEFGKDYIIGADVASGEGDDFSTAQVFTTRGMEQVAEYKGKMLPSDFGDFLCKLGGKYNRAALVCERNSIGNTVLQRVYDNNYGNMLWSTNDLKFVSLDEHRNSNKKMKPGIQTTGKTKQLITTKFKEWVRKRQVTVRSQRLLDEFKTYIWVKPNKADHMDGYHDDLTDAARFAIWARDTAIRLESEKKAAAEKSVQNIMTSKSAKKRAQKQGEEAPRGLYSTGSQDPKTEEDVSWLY